MSISLFPIDLGLTRNFQKRSKSGKSDVVVELAGGQKVVLDDSVVENRRAVVGDGLLVRLQQRLELLQLGMLDQPVQVHLLEDVVGRQLLAPLVLVESGKHTASLLACDQVQGTQMDFISLTLEGLQRKVGLEQTSENGLNVKQIRGMVAVG